MSHDVYAKIANTLDKGFRKAPMAGDGPSPAFVDYLKVIYTPEEAELLQFAGAYPNFMTVEHLARSCGRSEEEVYPILKSAHAKNGLVLMGNILSMPAIPILLNIAAGMTAADLDTDAAAKLHRQFFVGDGYYKFYETSQAGTPSMRTIALETSITPGEKVLKSEEVHELIMNLPHEDISLVPCPCRTRKEQIGERDCQDKNPVGCCIMLGLSALHFESVGVGKRVTKKQAIEYFDEMHAHGLVGTTDNCLSDNVIICLCCGCCCSHLGGRIHWDNPTAVAPSNFMPVADENCVHCGLCAKSCLFDALTVDKKAKAHSVDLDKCIGCGVCVLGCKKQALKLQRVDRNPSFKSTDALYKVLAAENKRPYISFNGDESGFASPSARRAPVWKRALPHNLRFTLFTRAAGVLLRAGMLINPALKARAGERDFAVAITTRDRASGRAFVFRNGKFGQSANLSKGDAAMVWKDARTAFSSMIAGYDGNMLQALERGDLHIEGDASRFMWLSAMLREAKDSLKRS